MGCVAPGGNELSGLIKGLSEVVFGDCHEPSCSIKFGYILDQMGDYQLLKEDLLSWNLLGMIVSLSSCSVLCLKLQSSVGRLLL